MAVKPIKAPVSAGGDFEQVPAGVYLARCFKMIDIGTQTITSQKFGSKNARQVIIYWELLQDDDGKRVTMEDGESTFVISKIYTLSMHKKSNLRKDLDSWRGIPFTDEEANDFEITKLVDKFCKLQVTHNQNGDKTYANVTAIMTTKKTDKSVNENLGWSIEDPDMTAFADFPQWLQDKIQAAAEWSDDVAVDKETDKPAQVASEAEGEEIDIKDVPF